MKNLRQRRHHDSWSAEWFLYRGLREASDDEPPDARVAAGLSTQVSRMSAPDRLDFRIQKLLSLTRPSLFREKAEPTEGAGFHATSMLSGTRLGARLRDDEEVGIVRSGDILQIHPSLIRQRSRVLIVYVLEVREIRDGQALVAAFSPIDIPASPDELKTGLPQQGMGVLALWNLRWFPLGILAQGWRIGRAEEELHADIAEIREARGKGRPIPERLRGSVGRKVESPEDPRWDYFEEEGAVLTDVSWARGEDACASEG